jgi:hypothetical protein
MVKRDTYIGLFTQASLGHRSWHAADEVSQLIGELMVNLLHRVYFFQARILQQAQSSKAEVGVKDINHITRSIRKTT